MTRARRTRRRGRVALLAALLVVGAALAAASCSSDDSGSTRKVNQPCRTNDDCADSLCHRGFCASSQPKPTGGGCSGPGECRSFVCSSGKCAPGSEPPGAPCRHDDECASGGCVSGSCTTRATIDAGPDDAKRDTVVDRNDRGVGDRGVADQGSSDGSQPDRGSADQRVADQGVADRAVGDGPTCNPPSCDDKLSCTVDKCTASGCSNTRKADTCLIGLTLCAAKDEIHPTNPCLHCDPVKNPTGWTLFGGKGCVTTLAGSGSAGHQNGAPDSARFWNPHGLAVDSGGTIYVADTTNHVIRTIAPNGQVGTLAGTPGSPGHQNGSAGTAKFRNPEGVAVDGSGKVYVADTRNHVIRVISNGQVATLAGSPGNSGHGDGSGTTVRFDHPADVAVDSSGIVYVADRTNDALRKIDTGVVSTLIGTSPGLADGAFASAKLWQPASLAWIGTNLVLADRMTHTARQIDLTGKTVARLAGIDGPLAGKAGYVDGAATTVAQFNYPAAIAASTASGGTFYIADQYNHRVRRVRNGVVDTVAGSGQTGVTLGGFADGRALSAARFDQPQGIVVTSRGIVIADTNNHRIRLLTLP